MLDPIQLAVKSLKDFKNNLILLAPLLVSFGLYFALGIFVLSQFLLGFLIFGRGAGFSTGLILYAVFFYALDIIILILIQIYIMAAQYGMVGDAVLRGKSSFSRLLQHGKTLFKPVLTYFLAELAIVIAAAAPLALLAGIAFYFSPIAGFILAATFILLFILFIIAFAVVTVFSIPILVSRRIGGFRVILEAFRYGKSHFEHVIVTVAALIALWLLVSIVSVIVGLPYYIIQLTGSLGAGLGWGLIAAYIISYMLSVVVSEVGSIIMLLYLFNSYFDRNPVKNWK